MRARRSRAPAWSCTPLTPLRSRGVRDVGEALGKRVGAESARRLLGSLEGPSTIRTIRTSTCGASPERLCSSSVSQSHCVLVGISDVSRSLRRTYCIWVGGPGFVRPPNKL